MEPGRASDRWAPAKWPWGVEALAFAFFLFAAAAPGVVDSVFVEETIATQPERVPDLNALHIREQFLGAAFLAVLYVAHICWAVSTTEYISLSASHFFAPTVFAGGAFVRMVQHSHFIGYADQLFVRPGLQLLILLGGVQAITFLLARRRMLQVWRRFRDQEWDLFERPSRDGTWIKLVVSRIQPFFYPPRSFRACPDGILVEGYSFAMPIPFQEIESVFPVGRAQLSSPGNYLATSINHLVGIKLYEEETPVFLSPQNPDRFFSYCHDRVTILSYGEG